jgi:hypothetical protein
MIHGFPIWEVIQHCSLLHRWKAASPIDDFVAMIKRFYAWKWRAKDAYEAAFRNCKGLGLLKGALRG